MAKSKEYEKFFNKRENAIRALKFHIEHAKEITNEQALEAIQRLNNIENSFEKYKNANEKLEDVDDFSYEEITIKDEDVVEMYTTASTALKKVAKDMHDSSFLNSTTNNRVSQPSVDVKLPRIQVPIFSGEYEEWSSFYDAFISLVDQNNALTNCNKMHYLMSALQGNALKAVSRLKITESNYAIALQTLVDRFENKRQIITSCLHTFFNQKTIESNSASQLRALIDTSKESLQCIENLRVAIEDWGPIVVYFIETRMDAQTRKDWETYLGGAKEFPSCATLFTFLETHFRIRDGCNSKQENYSKPNKYQSDKKIDTNSSKNNTNASEKCPLCPEFHWLLICPEFFNKTPIQRKEFVIQNNLCLVCLRSHERDTCKSKYRCKKCNGAHSVKIHTDDENLPIQNALAIQENNNLFATALIKVQDKFKTNHILRAFIDMGSSGAFISEQATQLLCLPRIKENIPLTGVDNVSLGKSTNSVQINIESMIDASFKLSLKTHVLKTIINTRKFPNDTVENCDHLKNIELADPEFLNPSKIDLLFGVDIYGIILKDGLRKGQVYQPIAQNSHLGWLILGANSNKNSCQIQINSISIETELKKFWENEEIMAQPIMTEEHTACVEHFNKTHKRLSDGSFMVKIPFNMNKNDPNFLGESRKQAMCRLFQVEKRFKRDPLYKKRYHEEINGYLKSNHMSLCKNNSNNGYFLPHHAIVRENRTTTKQRTVYDASAKSSNGFSLNDRCLNGPTLQPELIDIFIRWRLHEIALIADIEKMYRMIKVCEEDRKFQKILWRFSENEPIKEYELNTVTFGTKPAPFMAIATTFALADAEKHKYPEAAKRVKSDFYVDDCMSGSHCIDSAIQLQYELDNLFKSGGFLLRKWASNKPEILKNIPKENLAIENSFELNMNQSVKTLGLVWTPISDHLSFTINMSDFHTKKSLTKRQLLSNASKIFDPCGFLSPITIIAKICMQRVWKSGTDWDNVVPKEIQSDWDVYQNELPLIEKIKIKRWFHTNIDSEITLHGFCDSSEKAMACSIYIVQKSNKKITSTLVCSKTKVAPIATQSIPRLELNGAVLLAKLMEKTSRNLNINKNQIYLWTDSSIVLTWLNAHASRWQSYVAARVRNIQELFDASHWRHVPTKDNPADIASRGVLPSALIENNLWFHGPKWLLFNEPMWPQFKIENKVNENLEVKSNIQVNTIQIKQGIIESDILMQFTKFNSLLRITARIFRFINQLRKKETLKYKENIITVDELERAEKFWCEYVQNLHFKSEIKCIKANKTVDMKSSLKELYPKFNENGLLVVHGRLEYADFSPSRKFPIILPAKSHLSKLAVEKAHTRTNHGTIHLTLATVRQEYWILNARNLVKKHIHECIICFRNNPKPLTQLMAPLPKIKSKIVEPFMHTGMDFAGPFDIKISTRRNATIAKGYVCVFVCMVSKGIHLETVSDLSTQRFIQALRRFIARRGYCTDLYCDQGSNFKGASNELPLLFLQAESEASTYVQNLFANDRIRFHFNPPSAPHWGGQWESYVKLTKHSLNRISVSTRLTYEDMDTLLKQIEACINSRPLCAMTTDINDLDPLTAGHLLTGRALNLIPEPNLLSLKNSTLDQFQAIQKSMQTFWKRFYIEYLHTMHPRKKWYKPGEDLKINDLVVIIDDNLPPAKWLMGRVVEVHAGEDGFIRMATIQTKSKDENYGTGNDRQKKKPPTIQRPIAKLCKLPFANEAPPPPQQHVGGEDVPN